MSLNGGQAMVTFLELAATKPESAFDRPAMVTKIVFGFFLYFSTISKTFLGSLCAEAAKSSKEIPFSLSGCVICSANEKSFSEPHITTTCVSVIYFEQKRARVYKKVVLM